MKLQLLLVLNKIDGKLVVLYGKKMWHFCMAYLRGIFIRHLYKTHIRPQVNLKFVSNCLSTNKPLIDSAKTSARL